MTALQDVYKQLLNCKGDTEEYLKLIRLFGAHCFRKAKEGKLIEVDFQGKERHINVIQRRNTRYDISS